MDGVWRIVDEEQDMEGVSHVDMAGDTVNAEGIMDQVLSLDLAEKNDWGWKSWMERETYMG